MPHSSSEIKNNPSNNDTEPKPEGTTADATISQGENRSLNTGTEQKIKGTITGTMMNTLNIDAGDGNIYTFVIENVE